MHRVQFAQRTTVPVPGPFYCANVMVPPATIREASTRAPVLRREPAI